MWVDNIAFSNESVYFFSEAPLSLSFSALLNFWLLNYIGGSPDSQTHYPSHTYYWTFMDFLWSPLSGCCAFYLYLSVIAGPGLVNLNKFQLVNCFWHRETLLFHKTLHSTKCMYVLRGHWLQNSPKAQLHAGKALVSGPWVSTSTIDLMYSTTI